MSKTEVLLAGLGADLSKPAVGAARTALPGARLTPIKNLAEALDRCPAAGLELLVLAHPSAGDLAKAVATADAAALPRWAVVALDAHPAEGVEVLAAEDWNERTLARTFRSALAQHGLRRELTRARGDLLAIGSRVTHDLRTQVAGILAAAELLREVMEDDGESARAELLQPIFDSVDGLERLIVRLSFLTKVSAHGAAKKRMDMGDAVFRALQRMETEIRRRNASIVQPASWPEVQGEAPWIETVWCNLVGNALKYAEERPQIELGWMQEGEEHRFWIRDGGMGVPPEKRSQLFQPFHLLHHKNSPRGLGLPLAQRLVELQGGRCGYAPREEGGSDFYFTLPTAAEYSRTSGHRAVT